MSEPYLPTQFDALLRRDLTAFTRKTFHELNPGTEFVPGWHIEAMAHELNLVRLGERRRLLITIPPRHLKSITAAVAFPAWMLGQDPTEKFLVASYGQDLAIQHHRDFRKVVESPWFRRAFPDFGALRRSSDNEVITGRNGGRRAVSLGGAVTGFGADILIIDDLMKAADIASAVERQRVKDFYDQTLFSRLNDKRNGRIIVVCQRLHEDDLAGYLIEKAAFHELRLPAIAEEDEVVQLGRGRTYARRRGEALSPEREPLKTLEEIRAEIGRQAFSAQYQQQPVSLEGSGVRWERIRTYDERLARSDYHLVVQSWDTAVKVGAAHDFSVCTTWGFRDGAWWLLDLHRQKLEYPELKTAAIELAQRWSADVLLIEDASSGASLLQDLWAVRRTRMTSGRRCWRLSPYRPRLEKSLRFSAQTAKFEEGRVLFPAEAPFLAELKRELLGFPNTKHDDQVDSLVNFLDAFGNRPISPSGRREVVRR